MIVFKILLIILAASPVVILAGFLFLQMVKITIKENRKDAPIEGKASRKKHKQ